MDASQRDPPSLPSHFSSPNSTNPPQGRDSDYFIFLRADREKHSRPASFFSEKGLGQDIISVTDAEPDICLEVFYALYNTLWPQILKLSDVSFKDAWTKFLGVSVRKGSLCPPEKLLTERRIKEIKHSLSTQEGENKIFQSFEKVMNSTSHLKQKITDYPGQLLHKEDMLNSLSLIEQFYLGFRNKMTTLVRAILEKEQMNIASAAESNDLESLLEPKAVMMGDIFDHHWAYRIPRNKAEKILSLDAHGCNLQRNPNDPSSHHVIVLPENGSEPPLVYFKANGNPQIQPEKEFMLYSLYQHLQIPVPETALLVLTDVFEKTPDYFYAVQASEAVLGESPIRAYKNPETIFEQEAYGSQVIGALLTNPSDGSFKNFKYSPRYKTLISIDNDLIFEPELTENKNINVKSILYLLPQIDLPIPESIKTFFTSLDPHLTIFSWLQDLSKKNQNYQLLFTKLAFQKTRCIYQNLHSRDEFLPIDTCLQQQVEVNPELENEPQRGPFYPQILVSQNLLNNLIEKLQEIEKVFLNNRSVSIQALFEELSPVLGKYYRKLRLEFENPEEAEEALWGNKKNGIDFSSLSTLLNDEEFHDLLSTKDEDLPPETFLREHKEKLITEGSPLDRFIRRQFERKKKNALNLGIALKELRLLIQEGLTDSQSPRDIVDFCHLLSKMIDTDPSIVKEIISLFSNLSSELKWLMALEKYFLRPDHFLLKSLLFSHSAILGAFMRQRIFIFTQSEKQYLFDNQGSLKRNPSLTGRSNVTYFPEKNPEFYMKQYPEFPGYEFASISFMRLLGIQHLPYQDLIIINKYPVLLTQKIDGDPVLRVWNNFWSFSGLDPFHTGLLIISAMLLNPEDGKEDNFLLSPDGKFLIPIDNDHSFLPSTIRKEGNFWNAFTVNTALQTKTLLFCLDEMDKPIPLKVKQHILSLDFDLLLTSWMTELMKVEDRYNNLVNQEQQNMFIEKGTVLRIPFYEQFIHNLHWKAHKIQDILKGVFQPTPFDLLKAIEPFAAKCYQDSFKQESHLQSRFKAATNQLYTKTTVDGNRVSILNTRTMMEIIHIPEKDLQNDVLFQKMGPLKALELLDQLIEERSRKTNIEQDFLCELDEKAHDKSWFNLFGNPPIETALKEFLENPKEGLILKKSKFVTSSRLTQLFVQAPNQGMKIRFLALTESPVLSDKEIRILIEECPNLEYLNVSGCVKLKEIITTEGEWPLLARFEAKDCTNLEKFVSSSPIRILRVETTREMELFVEKHTLDIFMVSTQAHLFQLSFRRGEEFQIKYPFETESNDFLLDVIRERLEIEQLFGNFKITIGKYSIFSFKDLAVFITVINFRDLTIKKEDIQRLIMLPLRNLKKLDLSRTSLKAQALEYLIQGDWPMLRELDLSDHEFWGKELEILSRGNWPRLEILNLIRAVMGGKSLLNFILNINWPNLKEIKNSRDFEENLLPKNWPQLKKLDLSSMGLTKTEIEAIITKSKWPQLKYLYLSDNEIHDKGLEILSQGDWPLLEILDLEKTQITTTGVEIMVNLAQWTQLRHLDLSNNEIDEKGIEMLSQGNWPLLETLNLKGLDATKKSLLNLIMNANWPNFKEIKSWILTEDFVTSLIPRNWSQLEELDLSWFDITQYEIEIIAKKGNWPKLKCLDLSHNSQINNEGLTILCQGNWPLLQTLNLGRIHVKGKSLLNFILNTNWSNLKKIKSWSLTEDFVESLFPRNWPQLEELNLHLDCITKTEIEAIVKKTKWPLLKHLNLSYNKITDEGLEILSQGNWPILEALNLSNTEITTTGVEIMVNQAKWPQLRHLDLSHNGIDEKGLEILSQGSWPLLETLNMKGIDVKKESVLNFILNTTNWPNIKEIETYDFETKIVKSLFPKNWSQLEEFHLRSTCLTQNEIEILFKKSEWLQLKYIDLSDNEITDEGLEILSQGNWPLLETLNLSTTKITAVGVKIMVNRAQWPQLKHLDLSENGIDEKGLEILSRGNWPLLETLNLKWIYLTKPSWLKLILNVNWANLKEIEMDFYDFAEENFMKSLQQGNWPQLEEIDLSSSKITQNEIETIVKKFKWPQLKHLNLSNNKINEKGLEILSQGNWPALETLDLRGIDIPKKSWLNFILNTNWSNLKEIKTSFSFVKNLLRRNWPQLEELDLRKKDITQDEIGIIVKKGNWPKLNCLDLSENSQINDESLEILCQGNWPLLEILDLNHTAITKKGLTHLVLKANWPNLKTLFVPENWDSETKLLAECFVRNDMSLLEKLELNNLKMSFAEIESLINRNNSKYPHLKYIDISDNPIFCENKVSALILPECLLLIVLNLENTNLSSKGISTIVNQSKWPQLTFLNMSHNEIFDDGASQLALAEWSLLEILILSNTKVTSEGVAAIINQSKWPQLRFLDISHNEILDDGASQLSLARWPLLENLNLSDTKITSKGIEVLVNQSKWPLLKSLNISNNEVFNEGLLALALSEWLLLEKLDLEKTKITQYGINILVNRIKLPNLKTLDISKNAICDEGLKILASGEWPLLQHLLYYDTQVTFKGQIALLENFRWPNLEWLQCSLDGESFLNYNETTDEWSSHQMVREIACQDVILSGGQVPFFVVALDINWSNSKPIRLSENRYRFRFDLLLLPRDEWGESAPILPCNQKRLEIFYQSFSDQNKLESEIIKNFPQLEALCLFEAEITIQGIESLISKSDWSNLKELKIPCNSIRDEGLEMLSSAKWPQLEILDLSRTEITVQGIESLVRKSDWQNLKELNVSRNSIRDEGFEMLSYARWPQLEILDLSRTETTVRGIESLAHKSDWSNLKELNPFPAALSKKNSRNFSQNDSYFLFSKSLAPQILI